MLNYQSSELVSTYSLLCLSLLLALYFDSISIVVGRDDFKLG